jgi:hypothetical protein
MELSHLAAIEAVLAQSGRADKQIRQEWWIFSYL